MDALERALADLEGGERGLAFASGMAAITGATLGLAWASVAGRRRRGEILASEGIYGGSTELLRAGRGRIRAGPALRPGLGHAGGGRGA